MDMECEKIEYGIYEYNNIQVQIILFPIINNNLRKGLYEGKTINYQYVSKRNNEVVYISEKERILNLLRKGKGVIYNKKIIFATNNSVSCSSDYISFKNAYDRELKKVMDDNLACYLKDSSCSAMVKSFLKMYHDGFFDKDTITEKLNNYLKSSTNINKVLAL